MEARRYAVMTEEYSEVNFLRQTVVAMVDYPEDIQVIRSVDELGVLLTLAVNRDDMGKVIGRAGNNAKALRTLVRSVGMRSGSRVNLKILEPSVLLDSSDPLGKERAQEAFATVS